MVRLPRNVSAGARARRSLLFDLLCAAGLAALALAFATGIGVVGFFAAIAALALLLWLGVEAGVRRALRRRRERR
jgi:predicted lysophospholipase L1 biosynthesis ABC-type transport system permease subunit